MSGDGAQIEVDGRRYDVRLRRAASAGPEKPRIIIPAYQPGPSAAAVLRACIRSIQAFTPPGSYELWVVDNCSPLEHAAWLEAWPGVNVVMSRTQPVPRERRGWRRLAALGRGQESWGSYANAAGIEIGLRAIDPDSRVVMTLHMDTLVCSGSWLSFFVSKLSGRTKVAGVCRANHRVPEGVVHVLGCMVDYQEFKRLGLTYWPELPRLDVGDRITLAMQAAGFAAFSCRNTFEEPALIERIPVASPLRGIHVLRAFDDAGEVIFLHLSRVIPKSANRYAGQSASIEDWVALAERLLRLRAEGR